MSELLTAGEMRAVERAAIEGGRVTGLELMERAGRGVVAAILREWPDLAQTAVEGRGPAPEPPEYLQQDEAAPRAVVLCGPGNNGGDGFVIARLLQARGWAVRAFLFGDPARLPPDAAENYRRWSAIGPVEILGSHDLGGDAAGRFGAALDPAGGGGPDLVIDAVFGTGLTRPASTLGPLFDLAREIRGQGDARWVAVDIPTGLCSDSGRLYPAEGREAVIRADLTVTFHRAKYGHVLDQGPAACGKLAIVSIGLEGAEQVRPLVSAPDFAVLGKRSGHKFDHGSALVLSGGVGRGGAARLAARGALRIGAGLVTVGCPPAALIENAARLDAVMLRRVADAEALAAMLQDERISALCLGPGLGMDQREAGLIAAALGGGAGAAGREPPPRRPIVLDGDALTVLARHPELFALLHDRCVLTPHEGEFARLFPDLAERLRAPAEQGPLYSKADAARDAAARAGCTIVLKGPDTVIAGPDGQVRVSAAVYDRAAPWLATAGSGDVLAGFVTGLLARGLGPMEAAEAAAWLHVECALAVGPGLIAEDLPDALPGVFRSLGL